MLSRLSGICQHCAEDVAVVIHDGEITTRCPKCGEWPFRLRGFKGLIYIVSNPHQDGVKVGLTERDIESRVKQLNTTGVAGKFVPVAVFPSHHPLDDERKAHQKLAKCRFDKEHFNIGEVEAILAVHRALNYREPIIYSSRHREVFEQQLAQDREAFAAKVGRRADSPEAGPS